MTAAPPLDGSEAHSNRFDRLESWKEIAAYLRRDVRTVQRWHERAGLPVHRHVDARQRGVFAFRDELEEWKNRSQVEDEDSAQPLGSPSAPSARRRVWSIAISALLCAAIAATAWTYRGWHRSATSNPITTRSQKALRFYNIGDDAAWAYHLDAARVLFEEAIREDPDFALAHIALAYMLDTGAPEGRKLMTEHMQRALALSKQTTENERLRILAASAELQGYEQEAIAVREALVRIDPEDGKQREMLAFLYLRTGRVREGIAEAERAAALRPYDFRVATYAAQAWALAGGDFDRARPYVERARALWPTERERASSETGPANLPPYYARDVAWVLFFPAYDRWRAGDVQGMVTEAHRILDSDPLPAPIDRDAMLTIGQAVEMTAGRLDAARALVARISQESVRHLQLAVIGDVIDDLGSLRHEMAQVPVQGEGRALRYIRAGLYPQAEQVLSRGGVDPRGFIATASGELALRRGHPAEAITLLRRGVEAARRDTLSERYLGAESLAAALERLGRRDEALMELEAAAADIPRYTRTGPSAAFWLRILRRLSQAYRERGRQRQAIAVEERLRRLLVMADANHPLVADLARLSR